MSHEINHLRLLILKKMPLQNLGGTGVVIHNQSNNRTTGSYLRSVSLQSDIASDSDCSLCEWEFFDKILFSFLVHLYHANVPYTSESVNNGQYYLYCIFTVSGP